jgi:hypothetical protein
MKNRLLLLAIAALFSTGVYAAGETGQPSEGAMSFSDVDTNQDGYISKEEADAVGGDLAQNMEQYDQNQDQQLDQAEFAQFETHEMQPGGEQQQQEQPAEEQPGQM